MEEKKLTEVLERMNGKETESAIRKYGSCF